MNSYAKYRSRAIIASVLFVAMLGTSAGAIVAWEHFGAILTMASVALAVLLSAAVVSAAKHYNDAEDGALDDILHGTRRY